MVEVMLITGISTVVGIIFLMLKAGMRKCLEHDLLIDIAVTGLLIWVFSGSTTGIVTGAFTGGLLSLLLYLIKKMT